MNEILNAELVKEIIRNLFSDKEIEIIERPASYIIKLKRETGSKILRIILLPPQGFSANKINELSPHPEEGKQR
ncbi:hypothetical protein KKG83_05545 [Candidatus Micrarchaeota archaeon]|nr:hypothetical protein [Candidatus Micrarchaeota archaeon]MBU2476908.1 hypothetical protein [Candidatus Micrarchaeota archaeon]